MIYVTHDQVEAMTLADKIVLLRAGPEVQTQGSIAQVGSPLALYHRPSNLFVAEFIGSPKMNVLPANLLQPGEHRSRLQVSEAAWTAEVDTRHLTPGAAVSVGVRPEDLRLAPAPADNVLSGRVEHIEKLGESSLLYLSTPACAALLTVKVEGTAPHRVGEAVHALCQPGRLHLFDAQGLACPRTAELPA